MKDAAAQALMRIGLQRILADFAMRPRHYLESLAHFCDAALASPALRSRTGRTASSPSTHETRRSYAGGRSARAGTQLERRPSSASRARDDLHAFLESLRTQVLTIASLK